MNIEMLSSLLTVNQGNNSRFRLTDIFLEHRGDESERKDQALKATTLVLFGLDDGPDGKSFPLVEVESRKWKIEDSVELPVGVDGFEIVVKSEEGAEMGRMHLNCSELRNGGNDEGQSHTQAIETPIEGLQLALVWNVSKIPSALAVSPVDLSGLLNNIGNQFMERFERTRDLSDMAQAMSAYQRAVELIPEGHPNLPTGFSNLGNAFLRYFKCTRDLSDLSVAIAAHQRAVSLTPEGNPGLPTRLSNLGNALLEHFEQTGNMSDIDGAITVCTRAVDLCPQGHANLPIFYANLGNSLQSRFKCTGQLSDIAEAISAHQKAVELIPDNHANLPAFIANLGNSLLSRFQHTRNPADGSKAIAAHQRAVILTPVGDAHLMSRLNNLGNSFLSHFELTGDLADIAQATEAQQKAVELAPQNDPTLPNLLNNLGNSFSCRFEHTGVPGDIAEAIKAHQKAVELTPQGHPNLPLFLNNLGNSFQAQFKRSGKLEDISEAVVAHQKTVHLSPQGHASLPSFLSNLGNSFRNRFGHTGDLADIAEAISAHQKAVQLTPQNHANLPSFFNNLGNSFIGRFEHSGDLSDIAQAIAAHEKAVKLTPDGNAKLPSFLHSLGKTFLRQFERTGELVDLAKAIEVQQKAIKLTPQNHADLPSRLTNLGNSFTRRFERLGDLGDIDEAILVHQKAVHLSPHDHANLPALLANLGHSLLRRFEHSENLADITEAIVAQERAVKLTPEGHVDLPSRLTKLGSSFMRHFQYTGDLGDINKAITAHQRAVYLIPQGHANLSSCFSNLGSSFLKRFECTGDLSDIAESIAAHQRAIDNVPEGHSNLPFYLSNLGTALHYRFAHTQDLADIAEAIAAHERARSLTPLGHASLPFILENLGNSFLACFICTSKLSDADEAIAAHQKAVGLTPQGHADLPSRLNNLGNSFQDRFKCTRDLGDIAKAIAAHQQAVESTPQDHASLPTLLSSLGNTFQHRFEHTADVSDITEAIAAHQRAIHLSPQGHAKLPSWLSSLAKAFHASSIATENHDQLNSSIIHYKSAATCGIGHPSTRLNAAIQWAKLLYQHDPESPQTLMAFETAIGLISVVAGLEQTVQHRYSKLQIWSGFSLDAAAAACSLGQPHKALEWLEQSRCLVWTQMNHLRTPLDDLALHDKLLAQRFLNISKSLENAAAQYGPPQVGIPLKEQILAEDKDRVHLKLAKEWDQLLHTIRTTVPNFGNFLKPSPCSALLQHLPNGPIVIINIHQSRCDAIALIAGADNPLHIPLPNFSVAKANTYQQDLGGLLKSHGLRMQEVDSDTEDGQSGRAIRPQVSKHLCNKEIVSHILGSLWNEVVKPILEALEFSKPESSSGFKLPRIWWCPTGSSAFLPLHAAGIYKDSNCESVSDYAVSSYTPTITSLTARVKKNTIISQEVSGLFLTSQPDAPGASPIPGTTKEIQSIHSQVVKHGIRVLSLEGSAVTVKDALKHMEEFSCIHLTCHASQDQKEPLQSRFLFHDGILTLSAIIQKNLMNADLAFLSACQTSTGEEKLSDEAVHLAAGMLAAGYCRVVATMWAIGDRHAPEVAKDFYDYLLNPQVRSNATSSDLQHSGQVSHSLMAPPNTKESVLSTLGSTNSLDQKKVIRSSFDGSEAAYALHHAIEQLRKGLDNSQKSLLAWIPYVHFGL